MYFRVVIRRIASITLLLILGACGEPRAVVLPLQYPDGSAVQTASGDPMMAGYQTYGSSIHANATALYTQAAPSQCLNCMQVGTVVSEPNVLRQATGMLGASTEGAGAVMTGVGSINYANAIDDQRRVDNRSNGDGFDWDQRFNTGGRNNRSNAVANRGFGQRAFE